jgi:hypothetical protein
LLHNFFVPCLPIVFFLAREALASAKAYNMAPCHTWVVFVPHYPGLPVPVNSTKDIIFIMHQFFNKVFGVPFVGSRFIAGITLPESGHVLSGNIKGQPMSILTMDSENDYIFLNSSCPFCKYSTFTYFAASSICGTHMTELPTYPMTKVNLEGLTYGVELELVFAFHQGELLLELAKDTHSVQYSIEKNIPYFDRENPAFTPMILTGLPNHVYIPGVLVTYILQHMRRR